MNAHTDPEITPWLYCVLDGDPERGIAPAGDFLKSLARAAFRADPVNYAILRPSLVTISLRYPEYKW